MITLITLTQGNPIALQRTIDNVVEWFGSLVNDVVVGDLCVFESDRKKLEYKSVMNFEGVTVPLPFNELFLNGFGATLNKLAKHATNDICLYMNVGEIVEGNINLKQFANGYNLWNFNHATETHQWGRMWNRKELTWSGRIHEEVVGNKRLAPSIIFTMADTPKDDSDPFYSAVMNDIKELVYFNQYLMLVDRPGERGATNLGWIQYAQDSYKSIEERMVGKGARYVAFVDGDLQKYLDNCKEFQPHNNSDLIHFQ
jgi:hypothetical protein